MPSVNRVVTGQTTVTIGEGADALHVVVWTDIISPKALRNLTKAGEADTTDAVLESLENVVNLLVQVIISWDLTATDDGPVIPITFDALSELGVGLLKVVLQGIMGAITMGEASGTRSLVPTNDASSAVA